MPRKLLRVALVAAVIPALTPVVSSAQTGRPGPTVRTTAATPVPRSQSLTWWQKLRGQKPSATGTAKVVPVVAEKPAAPPAAKSSSPLDLEGTADMQLLRTRSNRVRPSIPGLVKPAPSKPTASPVMEVTDGPTAFPIDSAAPPQDITAEYAAPGDEAPRYDHTALQQDGSGEEPEQVEEPMGTPVPARTAMRAMDGMGTPGVVPAPAPVVAGPPGYVRVEGFLYPSPQPGIPLDVGTTMITNPALDPHEMLYAHRYRGLYGPFYHKTHRSWILTPFGIYKNEKRVLIGTEVRVNYKSHISPFSLFFPPVTH